MATTLPIVQNPPVESRELNPCVTYDPHKMHVSNTRWSRVWQVAALVTAAFFTALATAVIIYSTLHFPVHLPTVSILVFVGGLPASFRAFKYFWDKKDHYAKEAKIDQKIISHMQQIPLYKVPIAPEVQPGIERDQLKSVYARFAYFQEEKERLLAHNMKAIKKTPIPSIDSVDFSDEKAVKAYKDAQITRVEALDLCRKAALAQLQSAYCLHLIKHPYEARELKKFFTLVPLCTPARILACQFGDKSAEVLVRTEEKTYTVNNLLKMTPQELAEEIFEGQTS